MIEETFEHHVKRIFGKLREEHRLEETEMTFEQWLGKNEKIVGRFFLDDVESYMGIHGAITKRCCPEEWPDLQWSWRS